MRKVSWFSCGAASAVATKLTATFSVKSQNRNMVNDKTRQEN